MDKQQMEVKNFLMKAYYMDQRIDSKLEQMASLNELARKATSAVSDMPGSPNRNIHKTEDIIVKILELQEEIQSDISELLDLKQSIRRCGRQLEEPEEQVIHGRTIPENDEMGTDSRDPEYEHEESIPDP